MIQIAEVKCHIAAGSPLSPFWICKVNVTEKRAGQEEQRVISRLSEGQWFGEKALWG